MASAQKGQLPGCLGPPNVPARLCQRQSSLDGCRHAELNTHTRGAGHPPPSEAFWLTSPTGVTDAFKRDPSKSKINVGVGELFIESRGAGKGRLLVSGSVQAGWPANIVFFLFAVLSTAAACRVACERLAGLACLWARPHEGSLCSTPPGYRNPPLPHACAWLLALPPAQSCARTDHQPFCSPLPPPPHHPLPFLR